MKKKVLVPLIALSSLTANAQNAKIGNPGIKNKLFYSLKNMPAKDSLARATISHNILAKSEEVSNFKQLGNTGYFVIELKDSTSAEKMINEFKKQGIVLKKDEILPNLTCTTPLFAASDPFNDMGYWNSLNQNILKEKQLMDSIYYLIKANLWNGISDAGENTDLSMSEIPNGSHTDLLTVNSSGSFDFYRNQVVNFANATLHGSQTAGVAVAKINNGQDMVGMANIKEFKIKNSGIDDATSSKAALLAAMQSCIDEANSTGKNQILSVSTAITTGTDPDFDAMFAQADANGKVLFIIGAGNDGNPIGQTLSNPHTSVITVQAGNGQGVKASFSSYGAKTSFKGMGMRGLNQTGTTGTNSWQGSSASAPGVAGGLRLLWSLNPSRTASDINAMVTDVKNTRTLILNPNNTLTPSLNIGYLIQNLHFDLVHDYPGQINIATNGGIIDLNASTHDIQGGTIANPTYWYQQNQTGPWVQIPGGMLNKATLGVGTHNIKLEFDIAHNPGKCTQIIRGLQLTSNVTPIYLRDFGVLKQGNDAQLSWISETEINGDRYEIERSTDGSNYIKVGTVQAVGNSSTSQHYTFADRNVGTQYPGQTVYYRLKMVDKDATFRYSDIRSIKLDKSDKNVSIFPNPARDVVNVLTTDINRIVLTTVNDQVIRDEKITATNGITRSSIDVSKLPAGVYFLRLVGTDRVVRTEKIIVTK